MKKEARGVEILPASIPQDLGELSASAEIIANFSKAIHFDANDGLFTSVTSWPYRSGQWEELARFASGPEKLPFAQRIHYEAHLMIENPREAGLQFIRAGANRIIGHIEAFSNTSDAHGALDLWKEAGAEAGFAILIDTPLPVLEPLINSCDVVQVMSIAKIGSQGAVFDSRGLKRITELRKCYPELVISVDGGVSEKNAGQLVRAGANRLVVGSAIMKTADPPASHARIKALAGSAAL